MSALGSSIESRQRRAAYLLNQFTEHKHSDLLKCCISYGQVYVGISSGKNPATFFIIDDDQQESKSIIYSKRMRYIFITS